MKVALISITCALLVAAGSAVAQTIAVPKVMADLPLGKGAWKMEPLQMGGRSAEQLKAMGGMTMCSTAAEAMGRNPQTGPPGQKAPSCSHKVVEDSSSRAVIEIRCDGEAAMTMKNTIVRVAPKTYEVESVHTTAKDPKQMVTKVRMTHAGACSANDAVISMDKASPQCAQMKAQMAQMDPAKCPAGANNAACVQQMTMARQQMQAMCK
jgi:hypothetical protein